MKLLLKMKAAETLNAKEFYEDVVKAFNALKPAYIPDAYFDGQQDYYGASVYANDNDTFFAIYTDSDDEFKVKYELTMDGEPEVELISNRADRFTSEQMAQILLEKVGERL